MKQQESCKIYYCYKATNRVNGKVYIGFAADPEKRWSQHKQDADKGRGYIFHQAIRKYGWENFKFEILCCGKNKQKMLEHVEPRLIQQYNSSIPHGYNMHRKVVGASGRVVDKRADVSQETKDKISKTVSIGLQGNKRRLGCKDSDVVRKKKSDVLRGNKRSLGRIQPPEIRLKISEAAKEMWRSGRGPKPKLTKEDVIVIRAECAAGVLQKTMATRFGVCKGTIGGIVRREIWRT